MKSFVRQLRGSITVLFAFFLFPLCVFASPYDELAAAFEKLPHRLPGSPEYYQAFESLEKLLKENGLEVKRQTFTTHVPEYRRLSFSVDGQRVQVNALSPNNVCLISTGEKPISGGLVYLSPDELKSRNYSVAGKIVVLDWGESDIRELFSEGALAIVFAGNARATQWDIASLQIPFNISRPLFYVSEEDAKKHGLLENTRKARKAELEAHASWKSVEGVNLWLEIKAAEEKIFRLERPEAIILGARMDSFGAVPGLSRGDRETANCALLAELAIQLSKEKLERSVFVIFHGAAYNAFDGLRHFYFGLYPKNMQNKFPTLEDYHSGYLEELKRSEELLKVLDEGPIVKRENDVQFEARQLIRDAVINQDSQINYMLGDINIELRKNRSDELLKRKAAIEDEKKMVADLRRQINEQKIDPGSEELIKKFIAQVTERVRKRQNEIKVQIKTSECMLEIAKATGKYAVLNAYHIDLSDAEMPFIPASRCYEMPYSLYKMSTTLYTKFFKELNNVAKELPLQQGRSPLLLSALSVNYEPEALTARSMLSLPAAAGLSMGLPGFSFRSVPGNYDFDELPGKRSFDLRGMISPIKELLCAIIQAPGLSQRSMVQESVLLNRYLYYAYSDGNYTGKRFDFCAPGGKEVTGPAAGALAYIGPFPWQRMPALCGYSLFAFGEVNEYGYTSMPMLTIGGSYQNAELDAVSGGAMAFDEFGRIKYINSQTACNKLFQCYGGAFTFTYAPFTFNFAGYLKVVNGVTDGTYSNVRSMGRLDPGDAYFYIDKNLKSKIVTNNETFLLGSTDKKPTGNGLDISPEALLNLNVSRQAIEDTIRLNLQRLEKLHSRNIFNSVIELYHDKAEKHKEDSFSARTRNDVGIARGHEIFGQTLAVRAYRPLKKSIDDMINSVIILLIMTIPFAFVLERLIVGCTNIYRQMLWIFVFFMAAFFALFFTHPAFSLAQAPMIIFIAFFIIVMSSIVIYIVMNRFKSELMAFQGLDTSAHRVSSENSMMLAAILIGVSSMRNRPVKTFLTILTVVLLTFTIISFASFQSTGMVKPTYMGDSNGEARIESFQATHLDMSPSACDAVKSLYSERYNVFFRAASYFSPYYSANFFPVHENVLYNPSNRKALRLEALVGFEQREAKHSATVSKLMPGFSEYGKPNGDGIPPIYLSTLAVNELDLKLGDILWLRNMKVRLAGIFSTSDLENVSYLDNGKIVPPNFEATSSAEEKVVWKVLSDTNNVDASSFIWSSPELTALADIDTVYRLNGFRNAVVLYPKSEEVDLMKDANDMAEVSYGIVYSNSANGINRHFFTESLSVSGLGSIAVPLLLGALIILSSLLGSIADREKEIFTFSALGLSPKDVSVLFFAESGVYAIVGGMGGYLLSQGVSVLLRFLAGFGLFQAPEMNYSSLTTVYTILIVMCTVLLSTIYPALKAGRAANPGVARKWKMPEPEGNRLSFQFPFTVSRIDFGGILMFIKEHFENHSDSSLGAFAASDPAVCKETASAAKGEYSLSSEITLAPFDLGVAEKFKMYSAPSDIPGIDVVTLEIIKLGGSNSAWLRGNHRFVDEIRNQFLLWRSLPVETVVHYRALAESALRAEKKEGSSQP